MSDLGRLLKQAREARGLTLREVEEQIHIRRAYLTAVEEGDRARLPDVVYTRGLVLGYARFLELDRDEIHRLFDAEYGLGGTKVDDVGSHQPLSEPLLLQDRRWLRLAAGAALAAVVVFVFWWYWPWLEYYGRQALARPEGLPVAMTTAAARRTVVAAASTATPTVTATPTPEPEEVAGTPRPLPTSAALPLPTPTTRLSPTPTEVPATPTAETASGLTLAVSASAPAWLRVVVDGAVSYEGTLAAGEQREWTGLQSLFLLTGNAGGTLVVVNGEAVGSLGANGEVVRQLWVLEDGRAVAATPEA